MARMKRNDLDDVVRYFTKRDLLRINKKRSKSFHFKRHKVLRRTKAKLKRQMSWTNFEMNEQRIAQAERGTANVFESELIEDSLQSEQGLARHEEPDPQLEQRNSPAQGK